MDWKPHNLPRLVSIMFKEGLTVFRDQQFSADMQNKEIVRIDDVKLLRIDNLEKMQVH